MFKHSLKNTLSQIIVLVFIAAIFAFSIAPVRADARTYVVQSGDTLFSIAARFNVSVSELATINKIYDVNAIYVGQQLILPNPLPAGYQSSNPGGGTTAGGSQYGTGGPVSNGGSSATVIVISTGYFTYVIRPGDTLSIIATRFNTTPQTLMAINNIPNPNLIYVGQILVIGRAVNPVPVRGIVVRRGNAYIVQPGDTLFGIAARFHRDAWSIARANNILDLNAIFVGQALIIP